MAMKRSNCQEIISYILVFIALASNVASLALGTFNGTGAGGIFRNRTGTISDKYYTEVTPASYVFGTIWPLIFFWTLGGISYFFVSIFLPVKHSPLKRSPTLVPNAYLIFYAFGYGSTVAWYFAFDRESLGWSLALLLSTVVGVYAAIGVSLKRLYDNVVELEENNKVMLWMVRILVQNGLCVLATWVTIASSLGLLFIILYKDSAGYATAIQRGLVSVEDGSSIILGVLMAVILLWFVLENFVWEKYFRYIFTIYPVFVFAFSGVVVRLASLGVERNLIISSVALGLAVVVFIVRIVLSIFRCLAVSNDEFSYSKDRGLVA